MGLSFLSGGRRSVAAVAMCLLSVPLPAANRQLERDVLDLPGAADYVFHIGRNACSGLTAADFASLHPYGYYVVKRGRDVYLAGRTENGTDYALADFLRRYAGYRDFGSPFGTVRPHVDRLVLPEGDFVCREEPEIASYNLAGDGSSRFFGRDKRTTCSATHAMRQMVPSELFATHPEYFSMRDGKRFDPKDNSHGWQPCMCNPDLPKLFAVYAERYFKERPDAIGIPMGVNDGSGDCKCPGCEALYAKYGNPYVEFYNMAARSLAKSHPGKFLAFIAYAQRCSHAPRNFRMEPNVLVEVTGMRDVFGLLREWKAAGVRHFGIYEYLYGFSGSRIASGHYPHVIADFFRRARREFGMETLWEEYFCPMPLFDGGRQYVVSELMWNMDADVDALLDDYFSSLYGPAAAPMKRYHAIAERAFVERQKVGNWKTFFADYYNPQQFDGYTPKALAAMKAALAEAASLVREGTDEARRVRTFRRVSDFPHALAEARLCAREMDRAADIAELRSLTRRAFAALQAAEAFSLTPEEAAYVWVGKVKDGWKTFFSDVLQGPLGQRAFVEAAIDRACLRLSGEMGREKAVAAWRRLAAEDAAFEPFAGTVLAQLEKPSANLIDNPSFEKGEMVPYSNGFTLFGGWRGLMNKAIGGMKLEISSAQAHTGARSARLGDNTSWNSYYGPAVSVVPGGRYRASAWVKATGVAADGKLGRLQVNFAGDRSSYVWIGGRRGGGVSVEVPLEALEDWVEISVTFTAPKNPKGGDVFAVPLLKSHRQEPGSSLWWDDVSLVKLWEPNGKVK